MTRFQKARTVRPPRNIPAPGTADNALPNYAIPGGSSTPNPMRRAPSRDEPSVGPLPRGLHHKKAPAKAGAVRYSRKIFFLGFGGSVFASAVFLRAGRGVSLGRAEPPSVGASEDLDPALPRGGRGDEGDAAGAAGAWTGFAVGTASAPASAAPSGFAPVGLRGRRRRRFLGAAACCPSADTPSTAGADTGTSGSRASSATSADAAAAWGAT